MGEIIKYIKSEIIDLLLGRVYMKIKTPQFENNEVAYFI